MQTGTLRRYSDAGGYGFIEADEGADTFCHISKLRLAGIEFPKAGMRLAFEIKKHRSNAQTQAANIQLIA